MKMKTKREKLPCDLSFRSPPQTGASLSAPPGAPQPATTKSSPPSPQTSLSLVENEPPDSVSAPERANLDRLDGGPRDKV